MLRRKKNRWKVIMPKEGWGFHTTEYVCEWCGPGRQESVYRNRESPIHSSTDGHELTDEELALELHRNFRHRWDDEQKVWLP